MRSFIFSFLLVFTLPLVLTGCWFNDSVPSQPVIVYQKPPEIPQCVTPPPVVVASAAKAAPAKVSKVSKTQKVTYAQKAKKAYSPASHVPKKAYGHDYSPDYQTSWQKNQYFYGYEDYYNTAYYPTSYHVAPTTMTYVPPVYQPQPVYQPAPQPVYYQSAPQLQYQSMYVANGGLQMTQWSGSGGFQQIISSDSNTNMIY